MTWEKKTSNDAVLEAAMQAFWERGFPPAEAGGPAAQVMQAKVGRGSPFATFGDQRRVFITAMELYKEGYLATIARLTAEKSPRQAILGLFAIIVEEALEDEVTYDCFLINTAMDLAPQDAEISRLVAEVLEVTESFFRERIREGQAAGEIPDSTDAVTRAQTLVGLMSGLRVLARGTRERAQFEALVKHAASLLT